ncbi:MAG: hypothetical protein K9N07_07855 [Candidatus Cloacimonetes bacterium]|nr:hypothetical protein [Candidatus Cloacimonadota bacterium]MCF8012757.1 hypothetical protein [Candidatus Woesearchaeota archaeon]
MNEQDFAKIKDTYTFEKKANEIIKNNIDTELNDTKHIKVDYKVPIFSKNPMTSIPNYYACHGLIVFTPNDDWSLTHFTPNEYPQSAIKSINEHFQKKVYAIHFNSSEEIPNWINSLSKQNNIEIIESIPVEVDPLSPTQRYFLRNLIVYPKKSEIKIFNREGEKTYKISEEFMNKYK